MLRNFLSAVVLAATAASAQAEVKVLTSIKPLQLIATAIQGDANQVEVLLPPGASPHAFTLRPSDLRRLQQADVFYWIGPDLENFLPKLLKQRQQLSVALQDVPQLTLLHFADGHSHSHEYEHEHSLDAHLWLDPSNAQRIAAQMANDFSALDPANAATYQANLEHFSQQLQQLEQTLSQRLTIQQPKPFFVFHEAYNYLEQRYQLQHQAVFNLSSEVQAGAKHVQQTRHTLEQAGASCLFYETPLTPKLAASLTHNLPVTLLPLDPLATDIPVTADGYVRFIEQLGTTLADCLSH
ncbi:zinc ABC transporter substrate-binding protein [Thiopseudomonas alkaliphila]|uniref:zinc ABC transporter substrate-binding protein n=1 Tax=Thiopseudomonas alkaliphila TaxID=1697053 RepID=UPI00069CF87E|nr:zinc ABC transporter substrate-binding protein [Thiopseudomonas alkaliphila]AKX53769.1 ABC transporter substrate-binding protein [Thiopseudomonas alkaliphila]